jgi:c-di-GMP-binding flagellar brake protein YcgR
MQNRRHYYRHTLAPKYNLTVSFRTTDGAGSFSGELVNLSIGGIRVATQRTEERPGKRWIATFTLEADSPPLSIPVERIYAQDDKAGYCGFHFLARARVRDQEEQERIIWQFLLEEQRNDRRQAKLNQRAAG